jgi:hypothetical protein
METDIEIGMSRIISLTIHFITCRIIEIVFIYITVNCSLAKGIYTSRRHIGIRKEILSNVSGLI